ncbi:T9SS type A sorting domain-containing protein [Flexithrix dorotheae]|uniref:T9SS type A sorting domain-containing protein n=1 Tax=Flexithrix dorotheae TaxID=70993 RepID=UPI0003787E41|nr:T9SS type A sorting domain-containing protein [Flexithrix dorotheae]
MKRTFTQNLIYKAKYLFAFLLTFSISAIYIQAASFDGNNPVRKSESSFNNAGELEVKLFPNPYKEGPINLEIESGSLKSLDITLYNTIGKVLYNKQINPTSSFTELTFTPEVKLTPGLYFMSVSSSNFKIAKKLIVNE